VTGLSHNLGAVVVMNVW